MTDKLSPEVKSDEFDEASSVTTPEGALSSLTDTTMSDDFVIAEESDEISASTQSSESSADSMVKIERILCERPKGWFEPRDDGVFFCHLVKDKDKPKVSEHKICDPLWVRSTSSDLDQGTFGKRLEWRDADNGEHSLLVHESEIQLDFKKIRAALADGGLENMWLTKGTNSPDPLQLYVHLSKPKDRVHVTERLGWVKTANRKYAYVLPTKTVGSCGTTPILFDARRTNMDWIVSAGTLKDWRKQVSKPARASARITFAISVVFAAPLLNVLSDSESRFFQLSGQSGTGKSTGLKIAQSVLGYRQNLPSWKNTSAGLERTALAHKDLTMFLDEIGVADNVKQLSSDIYMVCNGASKGRSNKQLESAVTENWKLLGLASGELNLRQIFNTSFQKVQAGQELRLVNIPGDFNSKYGIFERVPVGYKNIPEFIHKAEFAVREHHGIAFETWLEYLVKLRNSKQQLEDLLQKQVDAFMRTALEKSDSDQIRRVCKAFAVVAVAGDMASGGSFGLRPKAKNITGWCCNSPGKLGDAWKAALTCFKAWRNEFGSSVSIEAKEIVELAIYIFETQQNRFLSLDQSNVSIPPNLIGWTKKGEDGRTRYLVRSQSYKANFCAGRSTREVDSVLEQAGILVEKEFTCHPKSHPKGAGTSTQVRVLVDDGIGNITATKEGSKK